MGKPKVYAEHEAARIAPQTENQDALMQAINKSEQVIVLGPAGTGKSFICAGLAADWYKQNNKRKLIITRPMVPVGEELGHLPGTLEEKVTPWAKPVLNIIEQRIGRGKLECDLHKSIEIIPLQLMRGETFDNAWILADECQNLTVDQAKMLVTRVGVNSKLLINGDIAQLDIKEKSGLSWMIDTIKRKEMPIPVVEFDIEDCQRSGLCKMWLYAMNDEVL
jgi:phosphate starvation-inducible protein PhoH and related proteins